MTDLAKSLALVALAALLPAAARAGEEEPEAPALVVGTKVGQRLPRFEAELLDVGGEEIRKTPFDSHANENLTAYVFMSRTCPYCRQYERRLADMARTFGERGLRFLMVYPTRATPEEQKIAYHKEVGFPVPLINDREATIARVLDIKKTPEIVLVSRRGEIVFRGGIDDSPADVEKVKKTYLKDACEDLLAGRPVRVTTAPLYG